MKTKMLIVVLISVVLFLTAGAQDYEFKVLVTKGKNELKAGAAWNALKVGASLKKTDEIRIGSNSYLGLIHSSGKPLEIKDAKTYKVSDLAERIKSGPSVLNKYTDFIISANTQKNNKLTATGAVHRGENTIRVFLPKTELAYAYGDSITIQWEKEKAAPPYVVTFTTFFGDELYKTETNATSVTINLNDVAFRSENEFQVHVFSKKDRKESEEYVIRKLKKEERARVKPLLADVLNQTKENTAINKLWQAGFFEKEKLYIDAATAWQKAVKLEPGLQEQYDDFLLRNGMNDPKKK
ncbi:MAG TPA: hypothetical protein VGD31_08695 [Sphingobacteriaceae bacterium]